MKTVILADDLGTRIPEESQFNLRPLIEGGGHILWHIMNRYPVLGVKDFVIFCNSKGCLLSEYFANYLLHLSDFTFDMPSNRMHVYRQKAETWEVALFDLGKDH